MNEFMHYPVKKRKNVFKTVALVLLLMALMFGSGYAGVWVSTWLNDAPTHMRHLSIARFTTNTYEPQQILTQDEAGAAAFETGPVANIPQGGLSLPDLFDGANPAVVAISTEIMGRNAFGRIVTFPSSGSGFLVSSSGYIVTNDHVIENAASITVLLYDGRQYSAEVVGRAPNSDLAVIKIEGQVFSYLSFGNSDIIRVGEQVAAIGNPLGELANSMTVGHISAIGRDVTIDGTSHVMIQTDAAINRGNSGGPLVNLNGEVIGVISAKSVGMGVEGLGFAIPSNYASEIIAQLIEHGFVPGRAILGILVAEQEDGVVITTVVANSAAERAGIRVGDIIVSMNEKQITTFLELRAVLDGLSPGDEARMVLRRGDGVINTTAILDDENRLRNM